LIDAPREKIGCCMPFRPASIIVALQVLPRLR